MSGTDILSTLNVLINLGLEIKTRLDSLDQAAEDLLLLTNTLKLLLKVFEKSVNEDLIQTHLAEFVNILDVLQSIANSCTKCAKALDIDLAGMSTVTKNTATRGKRFVRRIWAFNKIPELLAEIQRKAVQLERVYGAINNVFIDDIRTQILISGKEIVQSTPAMNRTTIQENLFNLNLSTELASIDQMMRSLMEECKHLQQRLQDATLIPNSSVVQYYQAQNPEGASFWKDRFQKDELSASTLRYETFYVSWARFIHEIETSFVLKKIPTGFCESGDTDLIHEQESRYRIDQSGTRRLPSIRPLWLPALRSALDPLYKGYVKPQDFFSLLYDSSLSDTLRLLTLENAGYGIFVECERAPGDLSFPAAIESPSDHVGWTSAQIVAVPTPVELGIVSEREVMESSSDALFAYFNNSAPDVYVYVRYLQTGQIERKSLSSQVRPIGGICIGAALSIQHELESNDYAWSSDLHITEFKACYGGQYTITAGVGSSAIAFSTRPLRNSFDKMLRDDECASNSMLPELNITLLGPSKIFTSPPKLGEKIQIEYDGFWYDSKVSAVDGDEIEYIEWDAKQVPTNIAEAQGDCKEDESDSDGFFFPEAQLTQLGKGTRRLWRPWRRDIKRYDVRPYRCFHIGDSIEAPVMYPDFRFHYHMTDNSQLYLPARIIDVQGDQYVIEFSPALSVHGWWPGRIPKGELIELVPGSGVKIENPFDFNRVTIDMDRVRPFSAGPRPALGVQSIKPFGWSSFQGVRLSHLEDYMERNLWSKGCDK